MSQAGYTPIKLYYSTTPSQLPSAGNLADGELAINIADMKLYAKNSSGSVTLLASSATSAGNADNLTGGGTGTVVYQSATGTTAYLNLGTAGYVLTAGASAPQYSAQSSLSVGTATNIAGGAAGSLPYNSASGTTTFLGLGTSGYVLTAGASAPQYSAQSTLSVGTATNLAGGAASQIPYQSASGTTTFLANGTSGQYLKSNGSSAPSWADVTASSLNTGVRQTVTGIGDVTIDLSSGPVVYLTVTGAITSLTFTNAQTAQMVLLYIVAGAYTNLYGVPTPESFDAPITLPVANTTSLYLLYTQNSGTNWSVQKQKTDINAATGYTVYYTGNPSVSYNSSLTQRYYSTAAYALTLSPHGSTWSSIMARDSGFAGIKTDGTLWTWGFGDAGVLGVPAYNSVYSYSPIQVGSLTTWSKVATAYTSRAAIKTDGTLWTWGSNDYGELGQNDVIARSSPVQVGSGTTWSKVQPNSNGFIATKTDGTLWAWGANDYGQLGDNTIVYKSSPIQVGALTTWSYIASMHESVIAIKTDGTMWAWGANGYGQLGLNDTASRSSPVQVGALTNWSKVSISQATTAAVKTDGTLWTWGSNSDGQLGIGATTDIYKSSPVQVGSGTTWTDVMQNATTTYARKSDGTLWGAGGQVPTNTGTIAANLYAFAQVGTATNWLDLSNTKWSTSYGMFALVGTGSIYYSSPNSAVYLSGGRSLVNHALPIGSKILDFTVSSGNFGYVDANNNVWAWGSNGSGLYLNQGDSTQFPPTNQTSPVLVTGVYTIPYTYGFTSGTTVGAVNTQKSWGGMTGITYGGSVLTTINASGTLFTAGSASSGRLMTGDVVANGDLNWAFGRLGSTELINVSSYAQTASIIAVKTNGTLWACGSNNAGQLGDNTTINKSSPVQIGALTTWSSVSAGTNFTLALKTDGTLWAWGFNSDGQLGLNDTARRSSPVQVGALTNWSKIFCASSSAYAIKTDGTLWAWGVNGGYQLGTGSNATTAYSSPVQIGSDTNWSFFGKWTGDTGEGVIVFKTNGAVYGIGTVPGGTVSMYTTPTQLNATTGWVGGAFHISHGLYLWK